MIVILVLETDGIVVFSFSKQVLSSASVPTTVLAVKAWENSIDMFLVLDTEAEK